MLHVATGSRIKNTDLSASNFPMGIERALIDNMNDWITLSPRRCLDSI